MLAVVVKVLLVEVLLVEVLLVEVVDEGVVVEVGLPAGDRLAEDVVGAVLGRLLVDVVVDEEEEDLDDAEVEVEVVGDIVDCRRV